MRNRLFLPSIRLEGDEPLTGVRIFARIWLAAALFGAGCWSSTARTAPTVEVVTDLLKEFDPARTQDCLECGSRPTASADGDRRPALFEHPRNPDRLARVLYDVELPKLDPGELLLFAFSIAIADGARLDAGADGVGFSVEVDEKQMFSRDWNRNRWEEGAIDLSGFAGRKIQLVLGTSALNNTAYDWAIWGNPRILRFSRGALADNRRIDAGVGAVAVSPSGDTETVVRLKPIGAGESVVWRLPAEAAPAKGRRWFAFDFAFPDSNGVEMSWEPAPALDGENIRVGAYPARPRLIRASPAQAVTLPGESVGVNVEVRNEGRGRLDPDIARVRLHVGTNAVSMVSLPALEVPALPPGETWRGQWNWVAPESPVQLPLRVELSPAGSAAAAQIHTNQVVVYPAVRSAIVESDDFHFELFGLGTDANYARLFRDRGGPCVGVWSPLMRVVVETPAGPVDWNVPLGEPERGVEAGTWNLRSPGVKDPTGGMWDARLELRKEPNRPLMRIRCELTPRQDSRIRAFWGPDLRVGDGTTRAGKTGGLFPGLEYLWGPERSSNPRDFAPPLNDRRTPQPGKYTLPLLAVTTSADSQAPPGNPGRFYTPDSLKDNFAAGITNRQSPAERRPTETTLALWWDPLQKWDGRHSFPSPRFASPNFDEGMENHRIGLFVPSTPDLVPENGDKSKEPFRVSAGERLSLEGTLMMRPEPVLSAVREWIQDRGGLPKPNPWPRSFQEELDICRAGFLTTLWDAKDGKWRHCIDWPSGHAPGFAALLWMDSFATENLEARKLSRERVEGVAAGMLGDGGPASLASPANCHIMQWEFPFLYGYLPEAMSGLDGQIRLLIQTQRPDGGWLYEPSNQEQADLGQAGDSVLGTCANRAATILRYARITGDANARAAGIKALEFMERFRVPRGGQTWECPMYEPDILAAAQAIKACVDGYRITGDQRWLHDAVYWAETGVPFVYLWSLPDKPMMLGATIPVFGSTFYTHSWLATPVQWCGLVYSYHVWHLAQELERSPLRETISPLPLALNFSPSDWRRLVELITVSGMYQQFGEGPKIGAYPDSISEFEKRNPAFLNPEDILINVLTLKGHDPDVKTARLKTKEGEIVVSSGAHVNRLRTGQDGVQFQLLFVEGEISHTLVTGPKPREVLVDGVRLSESADPVRRDPGWWWDQAHDRLYLAVRHGGNEAIEVRLQK